MAETHHNIPQINDPYVGKVYGNILDNFITPTYNLKLYMLRKNLSVLALDGVASYDDSLTGPAADQIILAQTGVTAASIDDVSIEALTSTDSPNVIQVRFTITQPGAATFLDQLQLSRAYLEQENDYMPIVFLEIRFQGWTGPGDGEDDDEDTGGDFAKDIGGKGPIRWKLHITGIEVTIDAAGSKYDITAIPAKSFAFTSPLFKVPTNLSTVGKTITEHVESFATQLNTYHSKTTASHEVPDEFDFDLSELVAGGGLVLGDDTDPVQLDEGDENILASDLDDTTNPDGTVNPGRIQDETLLTSSDPEADDRNRLMRVYEAGDAVGAKQKLTEDPLDEGEEPEQVFEEDKIHVPKDTTIEKYFAILLSMNQEFYTKISRKVPIDDPDAEVKPEQAYVYWFKMDATVTQLKFDKKRNAYAHKIVYKPRMYKSSRSDIVIDSKETKVTKIDWKNRAKEIFNSGGLKKAYHYIFTGLNDQILSLDIKYDNGIALLVPPSGGAVGQAAIVLAEKAGSIPAGEDITLGGVVENLISPAKNATAADIFKDFLDGINQLKDMASNGLSGLVDQLHGVTGLTEAEIGAALQGNNDAAQKKLVDALDKTALDEINKNNQINNPSVESFPAYDPELSGYNYSVDLVNPLETPLTAETLEDLGYITFGDVEEIGVLQPLITAVSNEADPSVQAATIRKGSVQNTLFGVIASQHSNDLAFLLQLDMTVRGDPWYLGKDTNDDSDGDQANFFKDDTHFYLSLRSPKTFDMDWRDEDSDINTGYWKGDGVSRTFGGIYRLISVTNNFSNGEFTVEINAQRVVPSQDPIAKPDSRGWVAPLTNDPNAADAPDFSGDSPREVWHDGMEGSRMPQGWYTHYQIQYWEANKDDNGIGVLPPTTENPDG